MTRFTDQRYQREGAERYQQRIVRRPLSNRLELATLKRAARAAGVSPDQTLLDAPCGTGRIAGLLGTLTHTPVLAMDAAAGMLSVYRANHPENPAALADAFRLPLADDSVDWVVSYRFFHHLQTDADRLALLHELSRVARRGVLLYLWLDGAINNRRKSHRRSLRRGDFLSLVTAAGLRLDGLFRPLPLLQPKAIALLRPASDQTCGDR